MMKRLIASKEIAASGDWTSDVIDTRTYEEEGVRGFFSYAIVVTGSGTGKIEYLVPTTLDQTVQANDIANRYGGFIEPAGASDVATGLTSGSYAGSFEPIPADVFKLKVTETGTSNSITFDLYIVVK